MKFFVKTPWWLMRLFPKRIWEIKTDAKEIFLSFDDGPHPIITPWLLNELAISDAKATFFCIGENVKKYPEVYSKILEAGHAVGNHTQHHLNGWKTNDAIYLDDIAQAKKYIDSTLFRPPYGRLSSFQHIQLQKRMPALKTIMWTVLSGDFDTNLSKEKCVKNVILNADSGSIIVFHDSEKAKENMTYALPATLKYYKEKGFVFSKIEEKHLV